MFSKKFVLSLVGVVTAVLVFAVPALAAFDATIVDITRVGCVITVTFTVEDAGTYNLEIWDDSVRIASYPVTAGAGATVSGQHVITQPAAPLAPGIGIVITDPNGAMVDFFDPYLYPDSVAQSCADSGGNDSGEGTVSRPCPIPDGSVVGDMPFATSAYWAPGKLTSPVVTINPGTYWVVGMDSSGEYYQIFLSCQLLWVPVQNMQPSFDGPWNGEALPSRNVG